MNKRNLVILLFLAIGLGVVYSLTSSDLAASSKKRSDTNLSSLFADVDVQKVKSVSIEQGDKKLSLQFNNGVWSLPVRGNYEADTGKVRALLLKIFDLSVSQKIPASDSALDKLGLSDEALKRGMVRLSFLDAEGRVLAALRVGEERRNKDERGINGAASGQYIRREGQNQAYLHSLPLSIAVDVSYWLDSNLLNVLSTNLDSIKQISFIADASKEEFELIREKEDNKQGEGQSSPLPKFKLTKPVPQGKEIQESTVSQLSSGLENLRLNDVFSIDAEDIKDAKFDNEIEYKTSIGWVYNIQTAEVKTEKSKDTSESEGSIADPTADDKRYFAKIRVSFDPSLVSSKPAMATEDKDKVSGSETEQNKTTEKVDEIKVEQEKAQALNDKFAKWVFELPMYQAQKFRFKENDLVQEPKKDPAQ